MNTTRTLLEEREIRRVEEEIDRTLSLLMQTSNEARRASSTMTTPPLVRPAAIPKTSTPYTTTSPDFSYSQSIVKELSKPKIEIQTFSGDTLHYVNFKRQFSSRIMKACDTNDEIMNYMLQYTKGEPHEIALGFSHLNADIGVPAVMEEFDKRYGDNRNIAQGYITKAIQWPNIKPDDYRALDKFGIFLRECQYAVGAIEATAVLDNTENLRRLVAKLPLYMHDRWRSLVYDSKEEITFKIFVDFVQKEAKKQADPLYGRKSLLQGRENRTHAVMNVSTSNEQSVNSTRTETQSIKCVVCKDDHKFEHCPKVQAMTVTERGEAVKKYGLCYGCFKRGHRKQECRKKMKCNTCQLFHPTLLHDDTYGKKTPVNAATIHLIEGPEAIRSHSMIVPVLLHHESSPEKPVVVYAVLDEQSDACFIKSSVLRKLNCEGKQVDLRLATILGEETVSAQKVSGLVVQGLKETKSIALPGTYSRESIPVRRSQIPRKDTTRKWPHLQHVADLLPPYRQEAEVGLLIGTNCMKAIRGIEYIHGKDDEPYAYRTHLGWGVVGPIEYSEKSEERKTHTFAFRTTVSEVSPAQVRGLFDLEFKEPAGEKISVEDRRFLQTESNAIHMKNGHFEMPLPLKDESVGLPYNRTMAVKRLSHLERRLEQNPQYKKDYCTFMADMIGKGYAEEIPPDHRPVPGKVWYIPHHGVYSSKKPEKVRVVFDCSAQYNGISLNQNLLQGPDFTNNMTGVLCRFREEGIAFTCDIESMFHQVNVNQEDRDYLRFLWWKDGDLKGEPIDYRMTVHLFGATSSPGCANFALTATADSFEAEYGQAAADFIRKDFYVDDGLKSVSTQCEAIQLIKQTRQMCERGGFHLHKFISNDKEVIQSVPVEDRAKDIQKIDLSHDDLPIERTLGVQWCVQSDTFQFRILLQDKPFTRRGILSTICSIFDPLGLVSPYILIGKKILKELTHDGAEWDDPIPDHIKQRWEKWRSGLQILSQLNIPRCYKSAEFGQLAAAELHHFSDASLEGLGQCSYLRLTDKSGRISTSLVMAKARVAPSKPVTVPRLELAAAVTSAKVGNFLKEQLNADITHTYWSDSNVVLGYIKNDAKRFHVFVANRVQKIRETSQPSQWRHVESRDNPADLASRGMDASEIVQNIQWWKGPKFLTTGEPLPATDSEYLPSPDDPEIRKVTVLSTHVEESTYLLEILRRFSTWNKAKRVFALCLRFIDTLKKGTVRQYNLRSKDTGSHVKPPSVLEMQAAENAIIKIVQNDAFPKEIEILKGTEDGDRAFSERNSAKSRNRHIKEVSSLYRLDPYITDDGLVRVGGRIKRSSLPRELRHPVILPKQCHVTKLIIDHYHSRCGHQGCGITLNEIRASGYWIITGRARVTSHVWKCVTCRKLRAKPVGQKMSDLPSDRLEAVPPFTHSAVDYFGPFYVKEGRKEMKRYGVLFTCLASRAIHIEVAHSLSTDSFLNAYRRFVCRRGAVRLLRADCGTNFIGAKGEQETAMTVLDQSKISKELLKDNCDWINFEFNVPHASHMGGVWERMIQCARNALSGLLSAHSDRLDDECLLTLLTEAEAIVNSRPLTYVDTSSPDAPIPLSPVQILTLKTSYIMPPPGKFVREDVYCHRRWKAVQFLANEFWKRWKHEFLPTLQERKKWVKQHRDLQAGDIVLMIEENSPRNHWPLGKIVETSQSKDGLIRKVRVKIGNSVYDRPVHKMILLLPGEIPVKEPTISRK